MAYLVGSVLYLHIIKFFTFFPQRLLGKFRKTEGFTDFVQKILEGRQLSQSIAVALANWTADEYARIAPDTDSVRLALGYQDLPDDKHEAAWLMRNSVLERVRTDLPSTSIRLLLAGKERLYEEYDRNRAESEFRIGISSPLFVLFMSLLFSADTGWPLLGVIAATILYWQGILKQREALDTLALAITHNVIMPPIFDAIMQNMKTQPSN